MDFVRIAAPTGCAAFNVRGNTLHSLLQLPVPTNQANPVPDLAGGQLTRLQLTFKNCQMLAIDEKSMVSTLRLHQIDQRLRQAKPEKAKEPFGGISILLMGDFAQLPPVMEKALFEVNLYLYLDMLFLFEH